MKNAAPRPGHETEQEHAMNLMNVDYTTKIPNNVNLTEDRQVLRALESWHPGYIDWWMDMGPQGFQDALVYLLQKYFGRDGREEAAELLQPRSGAADKPRLLGAFNEATPDCLSFHMFTFFPDRDGKMQLESLAQSGFDPLSRTCRFMLTEEAHH